MCFRPYDKADQLVSSATDGLLTTRYRYDAVGRLVEEGGKSYRYGWLDKVLFNDLLGSMLGTKNANRFNAIQRTAFGETGGKSTDEFFIGKPMVGELGYAFLFRNYRSEHGKWQTADPMGYPDG